jgi:glucose/arabinose dehydrogenase
MLYMSVGSTCNVCAPAAMTAAIRRMKPDGTGLETYAEGIRNSVGFAWHRSRTNSGSPTTAAT